jgi:hypothetical protein
MSMPNTYLARNVATVTGGSKTLVAADSGIVQNCQPTTAGSTTTITLPATALGLSYTIRAAGPNNGDSPVTIQPQAADGVTGLGFTAAVNKGPQVLAAVVRAGDEITLKATGTAGVTAWVAENAVGTWTRLP